MLHEDVMTHNCTHTHTHIPHIHPHPHPHFVANVVTQMDQQVVKEKKNTSFPA